MIEWLELDNFKGFRKHRVEFNRFAVVVGRNNAGKSSLIEALRIISAICKKFANYKFVHRPSWCGDTEGGIGVLPSLDDVDFRPETIFHKYGDPPARIAVQFESGATIDVFFGPSTVVYAQATMAKGAIVNSRATAKRCEFPSINILPQIAPLEDVERVLRKAYVHKCLESHLSSRHFRNQLRYFQEHFESFKCLFEQTWEGVRISEFDSFEAPYEDELSLMLSEEGFVAEASNFGHGLQMWLQIAWFLARIDPGSVVVLDEPDVYMHPEQQARMVNALRGRFAQCILSTHATKIIDQCEPSDILRVHRQLRVSRHGVGQATYDHSVDAALAKLKHSPLAHDDVALELILLKVVSQGECSIQIWDENGSEMLDLASGGMIRSAEIEVAKQILKISVSHPDDVDVYVNGMAIDIPSLTFDLDLNELET